MYPLAFKPLFQERIWGGTRLATLLHKPLPPELTRRPVGESWELADLPPGTVKADSSGATADGSFSNSISNGPWAGQTLRSVLAAHGPALLGNAGGAKPFPLLIKFLDAQSDLSVQVHPTADYARAHPGAHLKSEAWYILHAEPGARIYKGFKPGTNAATLRAAIAAGTVADVMQAIPVHAGDCHYLPSGTAHALGAGILAAEVQTPSDTTFRIFDWNRPGPDGKPRALHIEQAMESLAFDPPAPLPPPAHTANLVSTVSELVSCEHFSIRRVCMREGHAQELSYNQPAVWVVLEGQVCITSDGPVPQAICPMGQTLLLPVNLRGAQVRPLTDASWLEVTWPAEASAAK